MTTRDFTGAFKCAAIAAGALCCLTVASAPADAAGPLGSNVVFLGGDVTSNYGYPYVGWVHHFNGSVLGDGVLFRLFGFYAPYTYNTNAVAGGQVDGQATAFDAMVGYQKELSRVTVRGFIGPEFENDDLSPNNPYDKNRGADFGVKVQGELETNYDSPYYAGLVGSFGTAKQRYWTRLRVGYDFGRFIIGPEGLALGNQVYDEQRGGAFITVKNVGPAWVSLAAGFSSKPAGRGGDGAYGSVEVSFVF